MLKANKIRIYPNAQQKELIHKTIGSCRYIYNFALDKKIKTYNESKKSLSKYDLCKLITELKQEFEWLKEVNSQALQNEIFHLDSAFTKFFREKKGFPKFKSKKNNRKSFSFPQNIQVDFKKNKIRLPKIKWVKSKLHRKFKGQLKTSTVSVTPTGKYFVSILVDDGKKTPSKKKFTSKTTIGIDVGLKHFATLSTGEKVENPKFLKSKLARLKILQRRASKKLKGSKNRIKANLKVARMHEIITNQRKDFLHKLTHKIVSENQAIAIENLNVKGMVKNHNLAQAISDVSWSMFFRQLEYKCEWKGKTLIRIGRFEPSTKICSNCGEVNNELTLTTREWICNNCKTKHDRDINAAINVKQFALQKQNLLSLTPMERGSVPVEMFATAKSAKQESTT